RGASGDPRRLVDRQREVCAVGLSIRERSLGCQRRPRLPLGPRSTDPNARAGGGRARPEGGPGAPEEEAEMIRADHPLAQGVPPRWATAWGEDRSGVFAAFALGDREYRMRWIMPGALRAGATRPDPKAGELGRLVTVGRGFWLAERRCSPALWF